MYLLIFFLIASNTNIFDGRSCPTWQVNAYWHLHMTSPLPLLTHPSSVFPEMSTYLGLVGVLLSSSAFTEIMFQFCLPWQMSSLSFTHSFFWIAHPHLWYRGQSTFISVDTEERRRKLRSVTLLMYSNVPLASYHLITVLGLHLIRWNLE